MDPIGPPAMSDDERRQQVLQQMVDAGLVPMRSDLLAAQMKRGQGLMNTPSAQGTNVPGATYVAASPLEHAASAMARVMGGREMDSAEKGMQGLIGQLRDARLAYGNGAGAPSESPAMPAPAQQIPSLLARPSDQAPAWSPPDFAPQAPASPAVPALVSPKPSPNLSPGALAALSGDPAIMAAGKEQVDETRRQSEMDIQRQHYANEAANRAALLSVRQQDADTRAAAAAARASATPAGGGGGHGTSPQNDVEAIADAIVSGKQPPSLSELRSNTAAVRAALARRGYDLSAAQTDWSATQKHVSTMNGPQQERLRQAVYTVTHSLDTLDDLYSQWQKVGPASGFKVFNRAALAAAKNLPGEAGAIAQALDAQINDLTAEIGQVYMGGNSPTDHALKLASENLKADWNEETFRKMIGLARTNLQIRQNSLNHSVPVGASPTNPYFSGAAPAPSPAPALSGADQQAKAWADANPNDPRSAQILARLKAKGI